MNRVRFFPHWDGNDIRQVVGFLELVNAVGPVDVWVEVGSYLGESATLVLGFPQVRHLHCVERSAQHAAALRERFRGERCTIHEAASLKAAIRFADESIGCVYIDADHAYESVRDDIAAWLPKVRRGGFICGHDYCSVWPGAMRAVNEALGEPATFRDGSWLVRKGVEL